MTFSPPLGPLFGIVRGEGHLAHGGAGDGVDAVAENLGLEGFAIQFAIDDGIEEALDAFDAQFPPVAPVS
jgi:hypothetical protein